jgi:hypothetical protein
MRNEDVFGLAAVDGVAETPAAHRLAAALGLEAIKAGMALAAGGDRAGDDALADFISGHRGAEFFDDADGLMSDDASFGDGVLAFEDVDIGAADGGGGDAEKRVARADLGDRLVFQNDAAWLDKDSGFHGSASTERVLDEEPTFPLYRNFCGEWDAAEFLKRSVGGV